MNNNWHEYKHDSTVIKIGVIKRLIRTRWLNLITGRSKVRCFLDHPDGSQVMCESNRFSVVLRIAGGGWGWFHDKDTAMYDLTPETELSVAR